MVSERCVAALKYKILYTHPWVWCGAPGASTHSLGTMIQGECVKSSQATDFSNTRMRIALSGANTYTKILVFPERFVLSFLEEPWNLYAWVICTLVVCILYSYTVEEAIKGTRFLPHFQPHFYPFASPETPPLNPHWLLKGRWASASILDLHDAFRAVASAALFYAILFSNLQSHRLLSSGDKPTLTFCCYGLSPFCTFNLLCNLGMVPSGTGNYIAPFISQSNPVRWLLLISSWYLG